MITLTACHSKPKAPVQPDPIAAIQQIHRDILRGDLPTAEREVDLERRSLPASCGDCAERLNLVEAELLIDQGRGSAVAALLCKSTTPKLISLDSKIKAKMYCALAHFTTGQQQLSDREFPEAQSLAEGAHSPLLAEVLQSRGIVAVRRRQYGLAETFLTEALRMARQNADKDLEASDLLNLGFMALEAEHYSQSLDWFDASSQVARSINAATLLQADVGNIGWAYYQLGDYEVALNRTVEAEEQAEKLEAVSQTVLWLKHASLCRQQLGDLSGAEADYEQALKVAEATGNKRLISGIYWGLALVYLQQGKLDAAKVQGDHARGAADVSGDKLTQLDATLLQGLIAERQGNDAEAMRTLKGAYQDSAGSPSIRWKIENAIATLIAHGTHPQDADPWFRKSIATFEDQRNSVKREELKLPFFANGDELYRNYADFLITSKKPDEALHLLDFGRAKSLADGLDAAAKSNNGIGQAFDPRAVARSQNATILFYSLGAEKSWLWAIDGRRTQLFVLPKKAEIEARINAYQKAILKSSDPLRDQNADARALYDSIVAPAASMMPPGSRVILIPDGALNHLNFETLLVPGSAAAGTAGLHYWIQDVTITNANSIRLLPRLKSSPASGQEKTLLLMGNPVANGTEFGALSHADAEVQTVEKQFAQKDRQVFTQANAMPSTYLRSKPGQFSYIHFVAHGTASRLSPLDSAVVLSPSPAHPDSYKLFARDIVHQPIHADLVTISSCNGSGIRAYAGEGLVGLSWAFLRAGSHNVIGALWNVDDAATPQLMDQLYRELRSGSGPGTALRDAKLSLIHSDGVYRKPLYWAAFQLYAGS